MIEIAMWVGGYLLLGFFFVGLGKVKNEDALIVLLVWPAVLMIALGTIIASHGSKK